MAANLLAPNGLSFARNFLSGANTYQATIRKIQSTYTTAIGMGDMVKSSGGYIILSAHADTVACGVFAGVLPFYDKNLQGISHGLNGSWPTTAAPSADVDCLVIEDPFATFIAQVKGGPWVATWQSLNITWVDTTNGAPNASGRSVLSLDGASPATTNTFPFRILGLAGVTGGPQDPANTNPWIEVRLNTSEALAPLGI